MIATPEFVKLACSAITGKDSIKPKGGLDLTLLTLAIAALLCMLAPLEITQLVCLLTGAAWFAFMQTMQKPARPSKCCADTFTPLKVMNQQKSPSRRKWLLDHVSGSDARKGAKSKAPTQQLKGALEKTFTQVKSSANEMPKLTPSLAPVSAPTFEKTGFGAQVDELLEQITPKPDGERIVQTLTNHVKAVIQKLVPDAEVMGFVSGDFRRAQAFGVAVPEVDIVVNVSPGSLVESLKVRLSRGAPGTGRSYANVDVQKLQKSGIRACTDILVTTGGFKFRRSAFRGEEPKVTLLSPAHIVDHAFPVDFSVNCVTPLYNAALLTECGHIDVRAKELILLVKRWAKDRGICHAPKGHLNPYAWSLLAIYYLQVGTTEDGPLLPPLEGFEASSGLIAKKTQAAADFMPVSPKAKTADDDLTQKLPAVGLKNASKGPKTKWRPKTTTALLFKDFIHFYNTQMNWRKECVSVRTGHRAPPGLSLDIHIIVRDDGRTAVAPCIEDPFNTKRNLGAGMTALSHDRFHEELERADNLCQSEASLTTLLEPWKPPSTTDEEAEHACMKGMVDDADENGF